MNLHCEETRNVIERKNIIAEQKKYMELKFVWA